MTTIQTTAGLPVSFAARLATHGPTGLRGTGSRFEWPWPYLQVGVQINKIWIGIAHTSDFGMNTSDDGFWESYEGIPAESVTYAYLEMSATSIGVGYVF